MRFRAGEEEPTCGTGSTVLTVSGSTYIAASGSAKTCKVQTKLGHEFLVCMETHVQPIE